MGAESDLIALGEVMGAHGIHGELKVKVHNPDSDLLFHVDELIVCQGDKQTPMHVEDARVHGKGILMVLSQVRQREAARGLYGAQLCVPRSALPEPEGDEFYLVDAIGAMAVDPDGREIGRVEAFRAYPTTDVLCVRCADGLREVPILPPYFVGANLAQGHVIVDHMEDIEPEPGSAPK